MSHPPRSLLRWIASPAGFALTLICFGLPFIAVSCESPMMSITVDYTGTDLVFGGEPTVTVKGFGADETGDDETTRATPQVFAVLAFLGVAGGLIFSLLPRSLVRSAGAVGIATFATGALIANQVMVRRQLITEVEESDSFITSAGDLVHNRVGFVLALLLLIGLAVHNAIEAIMRVVRPSATPAGSIDASGEPGPAAPPQGDPAGGDVSA